MANQYICDPHLPSWQAAEHGAKVCPVEGNAGNLKGPEPIVFWFGAK
jgi:hypothetical protein